MKGLLQEAESGLLCVKELFSLAAFRSVSVSCFSGVFCGVFAAFLRCFCSVFVAFLWRFRGVFVAFS